MNEHVIPDSSTLDVKWQSTSTGDGNCFEFAALGDGRTAVRQSKAPQGPALIYSPGEVAALIAAAKSGQLDQFSQG
ncbi:DUF397 domain-containing protein [Streptomyces sp. NPDC087844]|uniref:DUF397 domain-containing protein n=1 Tax=Streptomyces sp. NPDC087844 TaxID=3365805 RepID=UPI0038280BA4